MSDDLLHELHADVFSPLHGRRCSACRASDACTRGVSIDRTGEVGREDDPGAVVSWPRCPGSYLTTPRQAGQGYASIGEVVGWAYERGVHRSRFLGAGGHQLIREWHRCHAFVPQLIELRSIERARRSREAGGR